MSAVKMEVVFTTFHDDAFPAGNIVDGKPNTFVLTTGCFPQEAIVAMTAASANVSRVTLVLQEAKDIVVEKCTDDAGRKFEVIAERSLPQGEGKDKKQMVALDIDPSGAGKLVKSLRVRIMSGYSEFVALFSVEVKGEESQQRIAIMEQKEAVSL